MSEEKRDDGAVVEEDAQSGHAPNEQGQVPRRQDNYPEPPVGWQGAPTAGGGEEPPVPQSPMTQLPQQNQVRYTVSGSDAERFNSARSLITIAQIIAIVSLFLGGVLLSTIAVIVAVVGYRRLMSVLDSIPDQYVRASLKRASIIAVVMSCVALAINAITLIVMMPVITQIMQTGDYSSIFGGAPSAGGSGGTSTTWG